MTPRELQAQRDVYDRQLERSLLGDVMYANVHFRERNQDGVAIDAPFIVEDFMGTGNRLQRSLAVKMSAREAMVANINLQRIKPGAPAGDDVPAWAKGAYHAG